MPTAMTGNRDKGRPMDNEFDKSSDAPDDVSESFELITATEILEILIAKLYEKKYHLYPTQTGRFCGFDVFRADTLNIKGIETGDFSYLRKLDPSVPNDRKPFQDAVRAIVENEVMKGCSKETATMWRTVGMNFHDSLQDTKTKVFATAFGMASNADYRKVTVTGRKGAHKVLPLHHWFPENLQDIDPDSLMPLLPPAERRQLKLMLGRVMVGANKTVALEGTVHHTFRSYGIIISEQGLGKSTFIDYIQDTLKALGYTTTQVAQSDTRFGWGVAATADLALVDDLVADTQKRLAQSVQIKSMVSNNMVRVEEKGMPAYDVRATSVIIGCSNKFDYSIYIGMDGGSIDRLN